MRVTGSIKRSSFLFGVAGGSGSGKTYFARALQKSLGSEICEIIYQDNFYIDQSHKFDFDGGSVNFDHPDSLDFPLLAKVMTALKLGQEVQIPIYDFVTHKRKSETVLIRPKPIIVIDGILIFHPQAVRDQFDEKVFFDTPEELRFQRRLERDIKERGRAPEGVHSQFFKQVKPMHDQFVEPSKKHANTVVKELEDFDSVLKSCCQRFSNPELLKQRSHIK
jgi:uridine kinase